MDHQVVAGLGRDRGLLCPADLYVVDIEGGKAACISLYPST
jgi:hypothetical protein